MNYNIEIDVNTIYTFGKKIEEHGNKYINILDKLISEVERVNECFDSETGKLLKEKMLELLQKDKELVNNKYISYSKTIKSIGDIYDETIKGINDNLIQKS